MMGRAARKFQDKPHQVHSNPLGLHTTYIMFVSVRGLGTGCGWDRWNFQENFLQPQILLSLGIYLTPGQTSTISDIQKLWGTRDGGV